nr:MAG: ORF1 [Torque teno midi virus]
MPWWWNRRRRYYLGPRRRRYRTRTNRYKRKRPRRRRQRYRTYKRRYRRRKQRKVRRKKKAIVVRQWQPDSITLCKIKGLQTLILGAEGKQRVCYTNVIQEWTPPRNPGGGGFAVQVYSLGYLYEQYKLRFNIWTKTNILKDLVRYIRCKFTFYRHQETDFIVAYERQPPFDINPLTYPMTHPVALLLQKHKRIILSTKSKPNGKRKHSFKIKPPKQMLSKWFFMDQFSDVPLCLIRGAACNFNYARLSASNENQILGFYYLDTAFYQKPNWAAPTGEHYTPYQGAPKTDVQITYWDGKKENLHQVQGVTYDSGWFQTKILKAKSVGTTTTQKPAASPLNVSRYNPTLDTGKGSSVWLMSILAESYKKPTSDKNLMLSGLPVWQLLYGFLQWVKVMHAKEPNFLDSYIVGIECKAFEPAPQIGTQTWCIPIDNEFREGKMPYDGILNTAAKSKWYPNVYSQVKILNEFVKCGPYIPKYNEEKNSTWELDYSYEFIFKWGGPQISDPDVADPATAGHYRVPDTFSSAIQIRDPAKQKSQALLHSWDFRRGIVTQRALKRMSENIETDTTFQPDTGQIPFKKKKTTGPALQNPAEEEEEIQTCLLSLCEEPTFPEQADPQNLQQLIQLQRDNQQQLKYNILKLITHIKERQRMLQLQTGILD